MSYLLLRRPATHIVAASLAAVTQGMPSRAVAPDFSSGDIISNVDTTISTGLRASTKGADPALIEVNNGGTGANMINGDDGDQTFDQTLVSSAVQVTHDLELSYRDYGTFLPGRYFYDHSVNNEDALTTAEKNRSARDAELLDAYIYGEFTPGEHPLPARLGNPVVNWGESLAIANGMNVVNPIDVAKLRVPGVEIREASMPSPMAWGSLGVSETFSVEGFYIFTAERTRHDQGIRPQQSFRCWWLARCYRSRCDACTRSQRAARIAVRSAEHQSSARADSAVAGTPIAPQDGGWADATSWVCRWITNMCVAGFRSLAAAVYIVVPMAMVSALCYALMYARDIGLTPYTLPVAAVSAGKSMSAIIATCLTLTAGVLPSLLSGLKYQSDMGLLLTFMFVVNMLAAILVLPARLAIMTKRHAERNVTSRQAHLAFRC